MIRIFFVTGLFCSCAAAVFAESQPRQEILHLLDTAGLRVPASATGASTTLGLFARRQSSLLPTSFVYGGDPSARLLEAWPQETQEPFPVRGGTCYRAIWRGPDGFQMRLDATVFDNPAALELRWTLTNGGEAPSGLVTEAYAVDLGVPSQPGRWVLHSIMGGTTGDLKDANPGFALARTPLGEKYLTVSGGRSSNGHLPFFRLEEVYGGRGMALALGWSGQWKAHAAYSEKTGEVSFTAGMEPVHFRLPPGESVRMPSALFVPYQGEHNTGMNLLRRVLRKHYQGLLNGHAIDPPVSFSSWFVFHNDVNEGMLTELAEAAAPLGIEYFCLDAGWFEGGFPHGVGNWTVDHAKFPRGLRAVADNVHEKGMKFGLWFEPERVSEGTRWHREHEDLLFDARAGGERRLLDLGKPEARQLILDMVSGYVLELGVDWIRYDFNVAPLGFWQEAEVEDAQGLVQLRYINGLYAVLDELMRRHPGLLIEQCASGGRRIDLETIRYGHTFWKSDNTRDMALMRFHQTGGNTFMPGGLLNTNYCEFASEGEVPALFAGPLGFGLDFRALDTKQRDFLKKVISGYKSVRQFINEDYHPLFEQTRTQLDWTGWFFIDSAADRGFCVVYRPESSPDEMQRLHLPLEGRFQTKNLLTGEQRSWPETGLELKLAPGAASVWRVDLP